MSDEAETPTVQRVLRQREVRRLIGDISPSLFWRWVKEGDFPAPSKIGPNKTISVWPERVVDEWLREQLAKSAAASMAPIR